MLRISLKKYRRKLACIPAKIHPTSGLVSETSDHSFRPHAHNIPPHHRPRTYDTSSRTTRWCKQVLHLHSLRLESHLSAFRLHTDVEYRFAYVSQFVGFSEEDTLIIRESAPHIVPLVSHIVDNVYEKLFSYDVTKVQSTRTLLRFERSRAPKCRMCFLLATLDSTGLWHETHKSSPLRMNKSSFAKTSWPSTW